MTIANIADSQEAHSTVQVVSLTKELAQVTGTTKEATITDQLAAAQALLDQSALEATHLNGLT